MMKTQETDTYLSSKPHGIPTVCKYNSLLTILKPPTTIFTIQLKSQMNSINNGTIFTIHILTQDMPLPEVFYLHPEKTGLFHNSKESNITMQLTLIDSLSTSDQVIQPNSYQSMVTSIHQNYTLTMDH